MIVTRRPETTKRNSAKGKIKVKRKRVITIEIERDVIVRKLERKIRVECPTCGDEVEVTIPPEVLEGQAEDLLNQVVKIVAESATHAKHADGLLPVSRQFLLPPANKITNA